MTDAQLLALFEEYVAGLDSEPFAHEAIVSSPVTPGQGQGIGCSLVAGAVVIGLTVVYLAVHLIAAAVTSW